MLYSGRWDSIGYGGGKLKKLLFIFLSIFLLAACGPSPEEIALQTNAAATATAASWTKTPTPTATYTPTSTNIPIATLTPKSWQWRNALVTFNDMAVLPNKEMWAIGQNGTIIHDRLGIYHLEKTFDYPGEYNFAGGGYLSGVDFISQNDGWLTASHGRIFHWDGTEWSIVLEFVFEEKLPGLLDIGFSNSNNGWAVGCYRRYQYGKDLPLIMQWDGYSWEKVSLSDEMNNGYCLTDVDVVSNTNVWVVGDKYQDSILLNWNGSQWQKITTHTDMVNGFAVSAIDSTNVWVLGKDNIFFWNGSVWKKTEISVDFWVGATSASPDVLAISQDNVWVGGGSLFHWNGFEWIDVDYDTKYGNIVDIEVDPDGNIWALTLSGVILQLSD
jgi:hypothetical protein